MIAFLRQYQVEAGSFGLGILANRAVHGGMPITLVVLLVVFIFCALDERL